MEGGSHYGHRAAAAEGAEAADFAHAFKVYRCYSELESEGEHVEDGEQPSSQRQSGADSTPAPHPAGSPQDAGIELNIR